MQYHEWEDPGVASQSHQWETDEDGWGSDCSDEAKSVAETAVEEVLSMLLSMYMTSVIPARTFCVLCYWLGLAGLPLGRYGMRPNCNSGHYKRHLDKVLGVPAFEKDLYQVPVVANRKHDLSRTVLPISAMPPHEQLHRELDGDRSLDLRLAEAAPNLPRAYHEHPVVKAHPDEGVVPIALYMDGVPYSHTDSVIGVWICNLLNGTRHLSMVIRKRLVCKCGCRSWCTFYEVFQFLQWSLCALAAGIFPDQRHDQTEWSEQDSSRAARAGEKMRRCALLFIKGDWMEYCERLGFPTWRSNLRPCLLCACDPASMYQWQQVNPLRHPFHVNTQADYDAACSRCEIWVTVTSDNHAAILRRLRYDKKLQHGSKGRYLTEPVPGLPLCTGDRLEPSPSLPDVGQLDHLNDSALPKRVLFWRVSEETISHHRNPIFNASIGVTIASIAVDTLHTLHLGVFLAFSRYVLWVLLDCGCWAPNQGNEAERIQVALMCLKAELFRWYSDRARKHPEEALTRLADLTYKMVGTKSRPKLKTKAAETWGLLIFLTEMLTKYAADVGAQAHRLREAGSAAIRHLEVCIASPGVMPTHAVQELYDTMVKHLRLIEGLNLETPKHHLWTHLVAQSQWLGNPRTFQNFLNESDNKTLKMVCRHASQATFETNILHKMNEIMRPERTTKRRRQ